MKDENLKKRLTIKQWAEDDRPREKMLAKGAKNLSDAELLAILLGSGNTQETAVELARRIIHNANGNLNELAQMSIGDLCKQYKGIGKVKAITILAAMELGNRRKKTNFSDKTKMLYSRDFFEVFEPIFADLQHEEFWIALLNHKQNILEIKKIGQGGTASIRIDVPFLLKIALEKSATAIVLAHNHPSQQVAVSEEDKTITQKIKTGCNAVGIRLLDHIITAGRKYISFADEGLL